MKQFLESLPDFLLRVELERACSFLAFSRDGTMTILSLRVLCWMLSFLNNPQMVPRVLGSQAYVVMGLNLADGSPMRVQHHGATSGGNRHAERDGAADFLDVGGEGQVRGLGVLLAGGATASGVLFIVFHISFI